MTTASAKVTKPDDFLILDKYIDPKKTEVSGKFPVFVDGVSLCCKDNTGYIEAIPIIIPQI